MNIHLIGAGGAGVSSLAKYYLAKGHRISGSDLVLTEDILALKKQGLKFFLGHKASNLPKNTELVIYTPATPKTNPELKEALKKGIKTLSYPQALGELTKEYFTIAISGTHGKSTTTAMVASILVEAKLDPTVIIGAKVKQFGDSNFRAGANGGKYLVIEADEHFASFLNYYPQMIVLTNIEADHLDFYKNLNNILKTFKKYISNLPNGGVLITNKEDDNIQKLKNQNLKPKTQLKNIKIIDYSIKNKKADEISKVLKIPGEHNVANAMAAFTAAKELKIAEKTILKALSEFSGISRRFEEKEIKINNKKITLINDFAHHPTEIKATLTASRQKYPNKKIWCFFQPHQHQRTNILFKDFVKTFIEASKIINKILITDIYDVVGREDNKIKEIINSKRLVENIKNAEYIEKEKIIKYINKNTQKGEIVILMGAGDINLITKGLT